MELTDLFQGKNSISERSLVDADCVVELFVNIKH